MEQKGKNKNSVELTDKKTKNSIKNKNNIKQEIKEENNNSKIIVVSLILALLVAIVAYVQITKNNDEKEKKNDKKDNVDIVEKQEETEDDSKEESKLDYSNSYVDVVKTNTKEKEGASSTQTTTTDEEVYYAITFEVNGGKALAKQILDQDETTYSVLPEREGWSFAGWYKDPGFSEEFVFGNKLENDITLYAKWSKFVKYIIDGEELEVINTVSEGEVIPLLTKEDLEIDDDSFEVAWNASKEDEYGNELLFEVKEGTLFVSDDYTDLDTITLELVKLAKFELAFYETENSEEALHTQTVVEGREIDLTQANAIVKEKIKDNSEFGWYYLGEDGIRFDFAIGSVANTSITKLYLSDVYEVVYNEKEESEEPIYKEIVRQNVSKDSVITDILEPEEKEDKTFDGWYIIDDTTKEETDIKLTRETVITSDINVVAKWNDVIKTEVTEEDIVVVDKSVEEEKIEESEEQKENIDSESVSGTNQKVEEVTSEETDDQEVVE